MRIRSAVVDAIIAHARAEAPRECCGLLIGTGTAVEEALPAENVRASEVSFLVSPQDHFAAIRHARTTHRSVVGAYHSHPRSPAVPSPTDVAEANDPSLLHVIVSMAQPEAELRAWRIADGSVTPVVLIRDG